MFTCLKRKRKLNLDSVIGEKRKNKIWPILSAHRGGSFERTENTLSAFKHAINLGINLLECDVHLTKDGIVVVAHDADLVRLCGVD